ncbi:uncharacterized protein K452DRAFT_337933 [Aplosporella prunicola CBS 121167]|uniref:RanBP2-type domain-containing protein n=1 Tax=Aplosporella prunicola CBS 121167 TaxID=1176127 RepID=A0A6A6B846_9PEZI|nr:uncharacterized protein K452DRAFT_337933 [Aplosporella prunicola CBS 121167]KAF2139077.1 hypothetical protein K452DRAFT_337933 [Aplosporella prunicola CBS 121167]
MAIQMPTPFSSTTSADVWVCCQCQGENLVQNAPQRCPLCQHYRCGYCVGSAHCSWSSTFQCLKGTAEGCPATLIPSDPTCGESGRLTEFSGLDSYEYSSPTAEISIIAIPLPKTSPEIAPLVAGFGDTWYCCGCGTLNHNGVALDRCPVCAHYKCSLCSHA